MLTLAISTIAVLEIAVLTIAVLAIAVLAMHSKSLSKHREWLTLAEIYSHCLYQNLENGEH